MNILYGALPSRYIRWKDLDFNIEKEIPQVDLLIGLREGATIISSIAANQLKPADFELVKASAYKGKGTGNHGMAALRGLANYLHSVNKLGHTTTVLVVDDVCDSGETLKQAREILEQWGSKVTTFAYVTFTHSQHKPDVTLFTEASDQYIYFPWETQDVCDTDIK